MRKILIALCAFFTITIIALLLWQQNKRPPYEGNLYTAKAYSHNTQKEYDVQVKFDEKTVMVYFSDQEFRSEYTKTTFRIAKGGFWEMQLDGKKIDDPSNIRLIDTKSNLFLYINITDPGFPRSR